VLYSEGNCLFINIKKQTTPYEEMRALFNGSIPKEQVVRIVQAKLEADKLLQDKDKTEQLSEANKKLQSKL